MTQAGSARRSVALIGPQGGGKTTLLESLLYLAGAIPRRGTVSAGNTVGDPSAEARARGISTETVAVSFSHNDTDFTVLDLPGSIEFAQEARGALLGVDAAIVVVEPELPRMIALAPTLHALEARAIPHVVFINKMDRSSERYRDLLSGLRAQSGKPVIPYEYAIGRGGDFLGYIDLVTEQAYQVHADAPADPIRLPKDYQEREQAARTEMLETLADFDDALMERLLEDDVPPSADIVRHVATTLKADQIVPVFMGCADKGMGVRRLLQALHDLLPDAAAAPARLGLESAGAAPVAQVLKTYHLPHSGKLSLARVWQGRIEDGMSLNGVRVGGVYRLFGDKLEAVHQASAGDIVGLGRLEGITTGDVLTVNGDPAPDLPRDTALAPMFAFALSAENRNDEVKLSDAFGKLCEEDPSLVYGQDPETHQAVLRGQGEIHLRTALDRLRHKYKVSVTPQPAMIAYRETIKRAVEAHGRHKKQSGGHGQFGDVKITIEPRARGEGFAFTNKVVGGAIPKQFIHAVEAGAREALVKGPLAGYPVIDVGVTVHDGQYHAVDSSEIAFKLATAAALKDGLPRAEPVLLEPICRVEIAVPQDATSKVLQLVSTRRGQILGYDGKAGWSGWDIVSAHMPQGELSDLIVSLRSLTAGVGFFTAEVEHLAEAPDKVTSSVTQDAEAGLISA